ncbi:hypothetical protein CAEBREN_15340 [Caenorhabditis brenneri]|uniref:Uncharacterized protein n=1 Tax=Caenorhabditis brenneri TaxID=135651 RepID=G0NQC8_CAEBE|nr:hypothetical protein CAEBREN_15340 [Caenorhabditis brenneri]
MVLTPKNNDQDEVKEEEPDDYDS